MAIPILSNLIYLDYPEFRQKVLSIDFRVDLRDHIKITFSKAMNKSINGRYNIKKKKSKESCSKSSIRPQLVQSKEFQ